MADVDKLIVRWDGFTGAPGYSVFHAAPGGAVRDSIFAFFDSIKVNIPAGVSLTIPTTGDTYDVATGELTGTWSSGSGTTLITCSGGAQNVGNAGACVTWRTPGIAEGHKVRGRTFLVPLSVANYATNGTLDDAVVAALRSYASALVSAAAPQFSVWHRPKAGAGGSLHQINAATVTDRAAILRSRSV